MRKIPLSELVISKGPKAKHEVDLPVYSVTKHDGFVPSLEYFSKQVFSRDIANYRVVEAGDFAYATIHLDEGSIGIAPVRSLISPMYTVFGIDSTRVEPRFLLAYLKSDRALAFYNLVGRGAIHRRRSISLKALGELLVPLPDLSEQRRIADILDKADALRAKRQKVLDNLDALTQSIFHDMFGRVESQLVQLDTVAEVQGGLQVSAKRQTLPLTAPYLRVANVHRGRLELGEIKELGLTEREMERVQLARGDLLFVEGHANSMEVGRVAIWDGSKDVMVHQNHLIRARLNPEELLPEVAEAWFNSAPGASHFRSAGRTTSGLNTISASTVKSAPVIVPPMAAQINFRRKRDAARAAVRKAHRDAGLLEELQRALQQRLILI